jgi:hypothetical protein
MSERGFMWCGGGFITITREIKMKQQKLFGEGWELKGSLYVMPSVEVPSVEVVPPEVVIDEIWRTRREGDMTFTVGIFKRLRGIK